VRGILVVIAVVMLGWVAAGTVLWLGQYGGDPGAAMVGFWQLASADWMLRLVLVDMLVFTIAAFVWTALDLRARGASFPEIVAWLVPMLLLGSAVLLLYLARRVPVRSPAARALS